MEYFIKPAINVVAANDAISSTFHRLTECYAFAQIIVGCLIKTSAFTAPITKLIKRRAEIAVTNEGSMTQVQT